MFVDDKQRIIEELSPQVDWTGDAVVQGVDMRVASLHSGVVDVQIDHIGIVSLNQPDGVHDMKMVEKTGTIEEEKEERYEELD
jgi:hypothetical protein